MSLQRYQSSVGTQDRRRTTAGRSIGTWCVLALAWLVVACGGSSRQSTDAPTVVATVTLGNRVGTVFLTSDGLAYFVPQGQSASAAAAAVVARVPAYEGPLRIVDAHPVAGGVVTRFNNGHVYRSRDGLNLGGGGNTQLVYDGAQSIRAWVAVDGGVVTQFSDGRATFSPDGLALGGGGATVAAYAGRESIAALRGVEGGVQTLFGNGQVYFSADGRNLGGGGNTVLLPAWSKVATSAAFGPRDNAADAVFQDEWWISGGFFRSAPDTSYFDLWRSSDAGLNWSLAFGSATPETGPRTDFYDPYSPLVAFRGELLAIGATVWASPDGQTWSQRSPSGPRRAREDAEALVFRDQLVFVDPQSATVYISADGADWSEQVEIVGFDRRCGAVIAVLPSGRLMIAGGGDCAYGGFYTDVWVSDDARTWRQLTDPATGQARTVPWVGRMWPCGVTTSPGGLWMVGGFRIDAGVGRNLSDVWTTADGETWREIVAAGPGLEPRHAPTCYWREQASALYVVAGKGGANGLNDNAAVLNDVNVLRLSLPEFLR